MELNNLQIHFHDKGPLDHSITYVDKNAVQCVSMLCSSKEFAQYVIDCLEAVPTLRTEREDIHKELCDVVRGDYLREPVRQTTKRVTGLVEVLRRERDKALGTINRLKQLVELPESAGLTELFEALDTVKYERDLYRDTTQPQLNEIRYVLHGDIQPCTVLYSDDTTTLLRLDEGDIMCETDTIEWSDSVTYRCQELLKSGGVGRPVDILAQLVRDERILLNDDALETETVPDAVPCPPAPAPESTCGNPYVHTSSLSEEKLRNFGWTTEGLVQNGYGHYKPATLAPWEAPSNPEDTWACVKCTHRFPSVYDRCPKCNTPTER